MKRYLLVFFIYLLSYTTIYFQTVTGKLVDQSGKGLASMQLKLYVNPKIYTTTSNSDGAFVFNNVTAIEKEELPSGYSVSETYPNPFNPKTRIIVSVPSSSKVIVDVYNILGERVIEQIFKNLNGGSNFIDIELKGLPNGVYIARLLLDEKYSINRKLLLVYGSQHLNNSELPNLSYKANSGSSTYLTTYLDSLVITGASIVKNTITNLGLFNGGTLNLGSINVNTSKTGIPCLGIPTLSYSGKTYNTVQIGSQCWLRENLDIGTMVHGTQDQANNGTIEKYCYNNDASNCATYGGLYQWAEAVQYKNGATNSTSPNPAFTGNEQGICPNGWHIPTQKEFELLFTTVKGDGAALKATNQGSGIGKGTNTSGFSGLLAGMRESNGIISQLGVNGYFLSATEINSSSQYIIYLADLNNNIKYDGGVNKSSGISVRCIKDEITALPTFEGSGNIGTAGGKVQITTSISELKNTFVEIPQGVLTQNVVVSISKSSADVSSFSFEKPLVIDFQPSGQKFSLPIKIGLPYNPNNQNTQKMKPYYLDEASNTIEELSIDSIDVVKNIIVTHTDHFSKFLVFWLTDFAFEGQIVKGNDGKVAVKGRVYGLTPSGNDGGLSWINTLVPDWPGNVKTLVSDYDRRPLNSIFSIILYKYGTISDSPIDTVYLSASRGVVENSKKEQINVYDKKQQNIYTSDYIDTWNLQETWYSGVPLVFKFKKMNLPTDNTKYVIKIKWCLSSDFEGNFLKRYTSVFTVKTDPFYYNSLQKNEFDKNDNHIDDQFETISSPILISPSNNSTDISKSPSFNWDNADLAISYDFQLSTSNSFTDFVINKNLGNILSTNVNNLISGKTYYWRVRAVGDFKNSEWSQAWSFSTKNEVNSPETPALSSPYNMAINISTSPILSWQTSYSATSYSLMIADNTNFTNATTYSSITTNNKLITGLSNSTTYYWKVNSSNSSGSSVYSTPWSFTTVSGGTAPQPPTLTSPNNGGTGVSTTTSLSWNSSSNATSYTLQISTSISFTTYFYNQDIGNVTSKQISGLGTSTLYYWRVIASNSFGISNPSLAWSFTTMSGSVPNPPTLSSPTNGATNVSTIPTFTWSSSNGATSYGLQVSELNNFSTTIINKNNITGTSDVSSVTLANSKTYYWRMNASNNNGTSTWSPYLSFTTSTGGTSSCVGTPTVTYADKTYNTVQIGTQCWLKENLDVGVMIQGNQDQTNNGTIEKYCYNNDPNNCTTYGGLYQWAEAVQYKNAATNTTSPSPAFTGNEQGICPNGWHIPTQKEFELLFTTVKGDGAALKATNQGSGIGKGTNTSGFSGLLAGLRESNGITSQIGVNGYFLSATEINSNFQYIIYLADLNNQIKYSVGITKKVGISLRCLKD